MAQDEGKTSRNLNVGRYQYVHLHKNKIPIRVHIYNSTLQEKHNGEH